MPAAVDEHVDRPRRSPQRLHGRPIESVSRTSTGISPFWSNTTTSNPRPGQHFGRGPPDPARSPGHDPRPRLMGRRGSCRQYRITRLAPRAPTGPASTAIRAVTTGSLWCTSRKRRRRTGAGDAVGGETCLIDGSLAPHALARWATETPEAIAVEHTNGDSLSYSTLHRESLEFATALHRLGVERGTHVGTMLPNVFDAHRTLLGIGWLRGVEVPLNTGLCGQPARIRHQPVGHHHSDRHGRIRPTG